MTSNPAPTDWNLLVATPVQGSVLDRPPRANEDDIPEPIRTLVEQAFSSHKYYETRLPDAIEQAQFVKYVKKYCKLRRAGRLSARVYIATSGIVRFTATEFVPRRSRSSTTAPQGQRR